MWELNIILRQYALGGALLLMIMCFAPFPAMADTLYSHTGSGGECCEVKGSGGDNEAWSQTFTIGSDYKVTDADLWASSQGGTDGLVIKIYADSGGFPTGSPLYTSSEASSLSTGSLNSETVTFANACLQAGDYVFTIERTGTRDGILDWVVGHTAGSGIGVSDSGSWSSGGSYYLKSELRGDAMDYATCLSETPPPDTSTDTGIATTTLAFWCNTTGSSTYCYQNATSTALRTQDAGNLTFGIGIIIFFMNIFFMGALWTGLTKTK